MIEPRSRRRWTRSSTWCAPPTGTSARPTTATAFGSPATSRCGRCSITTPISASWTVPVHGDGVHQVAVGPVHAGVIESGHFRFHVVGERILALDPRLFYKHRGLRDRRRRLVARRRAGVRAARLRRLRGHQRGRLRPGLRDAAGTGTDARGAQGAHRPARARAALQPPQRHRRGLRRGRVRDRQHGLRGAEGARPAAQPGGRGPSLPVRDRAPRPQRDRARGYGAAPRPRHAARSARRCGGVVAGARVRSVVSGPPRRCRAR